MASFEVKVYQLTIEEHPNADVLELARVGDYRSVVRKGQFRTGDLGVYIPEQAIVPEWILRALGMWDGETGKGRLAGPNGNRVHGINLRGILSQGLIYPVDAGTDVGHPFITIGGEDNVGTLLPVVEGQDVTKALGIVKWSPPIPVHMAGEVFNASGYTVKYDIENFRKYPDVLEEGEEVVMTEKLHGCVSPDTLVMLPNGEEIPIEEVINDDTVTHVMSYDVKNQQFKSKQITAKLRRANTENKRWVKLTLENGRVLKITEDHPIFSNERNKYVAAKDIRPNEDIKSPI
jgi:hypothetical protein